MLSNNVLPDIDASGLKYSKSVVRKAGIVLKKDNISASEREDAMNVLSNYRASHKFSLLHVTSMLFDESIKVDRDVIVAKRFKRTPSVIKKLTRFSSMELDRMQDIVGCRAIYSNRKNLEKVKRKLRKQDFRIKDYIKDPKDDGYRGIHLICKCNDGVCTKDYFVEVQLRTKIQHSWATAVEIVDLFTNQKLKLNEGKQEWKNFFKDIGDGFSLLENEHYEESFDIVRKCVKLIKKMGIKEKFSAYAQSLKFIESKNRDVTIGYNLILIDFESKIINVTSFPLEKFDEAEKKYLEAEKNAANSSNLVTALVSTESIENLKEAYPNYFAETEYFLENIAKLEALYKRMDAKIPSFFEKIIKSLANFEDEKTRNRRL